MGNQVLYSFKRGNTVVEIVRGDITEEETDVIVNAANSYLKHGGGVAGAIVRKGGKIIQEESDKIGFVPVGSAAVTSAGALKAKYVVHAVGPRWGEGDEDKKLRNAVLSALRLSEEKGAKSVSLPAISTGIFGFPKERGAEVILKAIIDYIDEGTSLERIRICNIDSLTSEIFLQKSREIS